jgi:TfoX/Sxy family transcriptional regulator of competence genes
MAYDEKLAARVGRLLGGNPGYSERRMFGGVCFLLNGNMCAGVLNEELIVRVAADDYPAALARPHARAFDFTGRPMKGFVVVGPSGCRTARQLAGWLGLGIDIAGKLPPRQKAKIAASKRRSESR